MAVVAIHQVALGEVLDAVIAGVERLIGQKLGQGISPVVCAVAVLALGLVALGEVPMDIDPLLAHGMDAVRSTDLTYRYGIVTNRALPDLSLIPLQRDAVEVVVALCGWELGML